MIFKPGIIHFVLNDFEHENLYSITSTVHFAQYASWHRDLM